MWREFMPLLMPGLRMPPHQTGHPVMGEIGPRRTAVFISAANWENENTQTKNSA